MPIALIRTIYLNKINSKLVIYVTKLKNTGVTSLYSFYCFIHIIRKTGLHTIMILKITIENSAYELEMLIAYLVVFNISKASG